jgi:hypothetical protein
MATVDIPILRAVLMTRQAISPRLAINIFLNIKTLSVVQVLLETWDTGSSLACRGAQQGKKNGTVRRGAGSRVGGK